MEDEDDAFLMGVTYEEPSGKENLDPKDTHPERGPNFSSTPSSPIAPADRSLVNGRNADSEREGGSGTESSQRPPLLEISDSDSDSDCVLLVNEPILRDIPELSQNVSDAAKEKLSVPSGTKNSDDHSDFDGVWHSTPVTRDTTKRKAPRARIPGPAGRLHDPDYRGEVDQDIDTARRSFESPAWHCALWEHAWDEADPDCELNRWPLRRSLSKTTQGVAKVCRLLVGSIAKMSNDDDPVVVLVDHQDSIEVNFSRAIMDKFAAQMRTGTIVVLRRVLIRIAYSDNQGVCSLENVDSLFSLEPSGYRATFGAAFSRETKQRRSVQDENLGAVLTEQANEGNKRQKKAESKKVRRRKGDVPANCPQQ